MKKHILLQNKKICYTDRGAGPIIVLLHGYLESVDIWEGFATELAKTNQVICIDIPGHGDSDVLSKKHTMKELSEMIAKSLKDLGIEKCFMIGHSMGGYVTLMFHELFPELLYGFSLFHSHPFPDTNETIKKRLREIDLVKEGKKDLIAKVNIPNAFAQDNVKNFAKDVDNATQIALKTSEKGIIANLHAMMNRPDLSISLENTEIPFLLIAGKKDNYIDFNTVTTQIPLPQNSEFCILENSGHMGFIEEKEKSIRSIINFLNSINK